MRTLIAHVVKSSPYHMLSTAPKVWIASKEPRTGEIRDSGEIRYKKSLELAHSCIA